jgi:ABC-type transport system involved in multi-copper enzyme maturation permease subunit
MRHLTWLSIVSGYRSNSFKLLAMLSLASIGFAWLAASFSARSPDTMMLDVGFSLQRIVLTLMATLWVQELYYKDLEKKTAIFLLSYPISRTRYLLARFTGVVWLVLFALCLSALLLYAAMVFAGSSYEQAWPINLGSPYLLTWLYFLLDIMVVIALTFLLCSVSETPNLPVLCALSFSVAMHAMGPIVEYLRYSARLEQNHQDLVQSIVEQLIYLLPDLSRLDIRPWSLYGELPTTQHLALGAGVAITYTIVFLTSSIISLNRREIN